MIILYKIQNLFLALRIFLTYRFSASPTGEKSVYFDLYDIDDIKNNSFGRLTYLLVMFFHENGYSISFRPNRWFRTRFYGLKYKNMILDYDPVFTLNTPSGAKALVVTDRARIGQPGQILLDYSEDLAEDEFRDRIPMPYVMHPLIYHLGLHRGLEALRKTPASLRLFFGGNLDPKLYDSKTLFEQYGTLSRLKVIQLLRTRLPEHLKREIQNQNDLQTAIEAHFGGFTWISKPDMKIPVSEWLVLLSKCDFFLACPGVSKPMCHNCVEAMSVATIPLLEYPEFFHPPLEHGKNCLVYNGEEDLLNKVNTLIYIDTHAIRTLQQGVVDYYESHLSPEAFGRTISSLTGGETIAFKASQVKSTGKC